MGNRLCRRSRGLACLALALAITAMPAPLAEAAAGRQPARSPEQLRADVEARFDVIRLTRGVGLVPKKRTDLRLIEIADGTLAIDGEVVTGREAHERLGPDADIVLHLTLLDEDARLAMLGVERPAVAPAPAPPAPPAIPDPVERPAPPAIPGPVERPAPPPAPPDRPIRRGDTVRIFGSVTVERDEIRRGDVVVIGGSARVLGEVQGEVVVVLGSLDLGPAAVVNGDVTVVGGTIRRQRGAQIAGEVAEVSFVPPLFRGQEWRRRAWPHAGPIFPFAHMGGVFATVLRLILVGLLASLVLVLARDPVERIARRAAAEPLKAGLVGFLAQILFVPLLVITVVILAISIIGIPLLLLVPFALVAALIVVLVGFTGVAYRVGQWARSRAGGELDSPYLALWGGLILLLAPLLLGQMVDLAGGVFRALGFVLVMTGLLVEYAAWTAGLGAAILTRLGAGRPPAPAVAGATPESGMQPSPTS